MYESEGLDAEIFPGNYQPYDLNEVSHVILSDNMKTYAKTLSTILLTVGIVLSIFSLSRIVSASPAPFEHIEASAQTITITPTPIATIDPDTIGDTSGVIVVGIIIVLIIIVGIIWGGIVYQREYNDRD
ncbi:hypothetical protein ACFLXB_10170 [Chloroflexota bacterium]